METNEFMNVVKDMHSVEPLGFDKFLVKSGDRQLVFLVVDISRPTKDAPDLGQAVANPGDEGVAPSE